MEVNVWFVKHSINSLTLNKACLVNAYVVIKLFAYGIFFYYIRVETYLSKHTQCVECGTIMQDSTALCQFL